MVLEKTLESTLDFKEIHQSIIKEIRPEYSLERMNIPEAETEAEAETPILWPPDAES